MVYNLGPNRVVDGLGSLHDIVDLPLLKGLALHLQSLPHERFQELHDCTLHRELDVSELFVNFMPEHFSEEQDFMVEVRVGLHASDQCFHLFSDDGLESVLLREVSGKELLHRFSILL